jgi:hypothetical protein
MDEPKSDPQSEKKLQFHFIKSNHYRVIHVDGAHGGLTPRGQIFIALYSERVPIPEMIVHGVAENRLTGELLAERKSKRGIVREVEAGVVMDLGAAQALHEWLGKKVAELENALAARDKGEVSE